MNHAALRRPALALAIACCFAQPVLADDTPATIIVSASRFPDAPSDAIVGATVITADDIRRAGAADVNEAIRKIGGVYGRQSLDGSANFGLDLRGFGANSAQNLVVMIDGVRLSENELAGANLSAIPVDTVERIEIMRGGASVLYGDGATGGVINIVTRRGAASRGSVFAEAGRFHALDLRVTAATGWNGFALDVAGAHQQTDNYRRHNDYRQNTFSGGMQWSWAGGRAGVRVDSARERSDFPGSLTLAQFQADPRQASTPQDHGGVDTDRATAFAEQRFGAVDVAAELSHREKTTTASYFYDFGTGLTESKGRYDSRQDQFSPRLRWQSRVEGMHNEFVAGIDWIRWTRNTTADYSLADAKQTSRGAYLRDELRFGRRGRLAAGARHETFDKDYVDPLSYSNPNPESTSQSQNAWEVQGAYGIGDLVDVYGKVGQSYRVANADENSYRSSITALKGQVSHDLEFGVTAGDAQAQLTARVFRHNLSNEIFFDPTLNYGTNTNLDPTRREGAELDGYVTLAGVWRMTGHLQHVDASFRAGPNSGREMVLVPKNVLTARLAWVPGDGQNADLGAQWTASQRYGSDFTNACGERIPSFATWDARYARTLGNWEFALSGLNLADKRYYSNAYACRAGIYPSDGRQLKFSARYDFR
jgi:iron complex outermembrane receptor protein